MTAGGGCGAVQGFGGGPGGARVHFTRGGFTDPNDIFAQFFGTSSPFDAESIFGDMPRRGSGGGFGE